MLREDKGVADEFGPPDPKNPLADMHYLEGYLDFVYNNDDAPDGAWFAMCVGTIEEHWPDCDGHECFMSYLEWRAKEKDDVIEA
jgi:hypothetical protein